MRIDMNFGVDIDKIRYLTPVETVQGSQEIS